MKKDDKLNINIYTEYLILDNFEKEPHTCILKELMNKQNDVYIILMSDLELPKIIHEWRYEDEAYIISTQNLYFDHQELVQLSLKNNFAFDESMIYEIHSMCGGWILLIVLFLEGCNAQDYRIFPNYRMMRLLETYVYDCLSEEMQKYFIFSLY